MKFTHFHPTKDDDPKYPGKDYPMTEEEMDVGWILLTCSECKTEVFIKPEK
jgi:hypothetical protein